MYGDVNRLGVRATDTLSVEAMSKSIQPIEHGSAKRLSTF
jgi:hypothetical protein